ncbi:sensor histidine kinase [Propionimicrobium lymphophilum]|nr:sensor histidine kinase [Propionimicrobium lymphophilum]MDK7709288.1 sensor histidine kinase [Propionimicrobium lymphophilum]MDK7733276.1 sensor histidine kinase [Propionimicrobium lymphophilum]
MSSMSQLLEKHSNLSKDNHDWLVSLVEHWHLLADTSFSDLVLWVPDAEDDNIFWAVAHIRPTTGPTAIEEEVVGDEINYDPESPVTTAYFSQEIYRTSEHSMDAGIPVDTCGIPIIRNGQVIGVVERNTNQMGVRAPGALEDAYLEIAKILEEMLYRGEYPVCDSSEDYYPPMAGDGMTLLSDIGFVLYANPTAVSAWRRLGILQDLMGDNLEDLLSRVDELHSGRDSAEEPWKLGLKQLASFELETANTALQIQVVPLKTEEKERTLVLCRDVTEVRERDRELVTKDAIIREIHHRVKNNLQTVAALLRMQSRRLDSESSREAMRDAMRRVESIATVHEILSQSFDEVVNFDEVADRILSMVGDVAASDGLVSTRRDGTFGMVPAEVATSLSLAVTELCQNGVEHGLDSGSGELLLKPNRKDNQLVVEVIDNGAGLPENFDINNTNSLGLSIVMTLIQDLGGEFMLVDSGEESPFKHGATARIIIPINHKKIDLG